LLYGHLRGGFVLLLEYVSDAIIAVDVADRIVLVNSGAEALFGYSRRELTGQPLERILPVGTSRDPGWSRDQRPDITGSGIEARGRRSDGTVFNAEISFATTEDDESIVRWVAVRDTTPSTHAEAKFRGLLEAAPDAIVCVDTDGTIALVNAQAEALFGYTRGELFGRPVELLVPDAHRSLHVEQRQRFARAPRTRPMGVGLELAGRRKDGSVFPAEISLASITTGEGTLITAAIRDVTDRIEAERERDRLRAEDEQHRLAARLEQSQRLESLGQLAGGVAHDFNNLIAAILSYASFVSAELARDLEAAGARSERVQGLLDDVDQITQAAQRAARLTHQLLAFGRRDFVNPEVLDLNATVADVETLLRRTLGEHVTLATSCETGLDAVRADRGQIEQVLVNLAVNARDAMPSGGTLAIDTANLAVDDEYAALHPGLRAGPYVRLRVSDTGTGMDAEVRQRAFEPFFTTKPKGEGTGLGLATVYGIVSQAGGRVDLYSEPGMGTTIAILLPTVDEPVSEASRPAGVAAGGDETILVVEDEDAVREVTRRSLAAFGYRVLVATGGRQALKIVEAEGGHIDLLLTDVVMPEMTGRELAERVSRRCPGIRVLYMSGYAEPLVTAHGDLDPTARLVPKPFTTSILLGAVRDRLDAG
jgi:PAS domain S-box-containing protein